MSQTNALKFKDLKSGLLHSNLSSVFLVLSNRVYVDIHRQTYFLTPKSEDTEVRPSFSFLKIPGELL